MHGEYPLSSGKGAMITEKVTKLDVARRQLDEAIRMFFEKRDTVSTHTVASAAAQVLADLGKDRGSQGWTRNKALVKPGRWREWRDAIARFEAFFKHADNDADATCDFHPEITPFFIIESIELLRVFTGKFTWAGLIFSIWFSIKYPELLRQSDLKMAIVSQSLGEELDVNDFSIMADLLNVRDAALQGAMDNTLM
jgi:hypothetical protein